MFRCSGIDQEWQGGDVLVLTLNSLHTHLNPFQKNSDYCTCYHRRSQDHSRMAACAQVMLFLARQGLVGPPALSIPQTAAMVAF